MFFYLREIKGKQLAIILAHTIIMSTAGASSVFLMSYSNMIIN